MAIPSIALVYPDNNITIDKTLSYFTFTYTDSVDNLTASSVVFELDTANTFDTVNKITSTNTSVASGKTKSAVIMFELTSGTWYWRVTATNADGTTVSDIRTINVNAVPKRAYYQYENIAKLDVWTKKRAYYQYENVGKYGPDWTKTRAYYQYENITSDPPTPWIERLSTYRAARNSTIYIYGNGFGYGIADDTSNADRYLRQYAGEVYIGDKKCAVTTWSWTQIAVVIPADAVSGALKVKLNKPDSAGIRTSNGIGVEVETIIEPVETGLELWVCDKSAPNVRVALLHSAKDKNFQEVLNAPGAGQFSINAFAMSDTERSAIVNGNLVLCQINGIDYFKWIIENIKPTDVSTGERGDGKIDVSGRGILALLKDAIIYPEQLLSYPTLKRDFVSTSFAWALITFLNEAQARGCLPGVTWDFTFARDSFGVDWNDITDYSFNVGENLLNVVDKGSNQLGICDIYMDTNLCIHAYIKKAPAFGKGTDMSNSIIFRPGQAIMSLSSFFNSPDIFNVAFVEGKDGLCTIVSDSESITLYGRKETYLKVGDIYGPALDYYSYAMIASKGQLNWGFEMVVSWQYFKIGIDYYLGDYIKIYVPEHGQGSEIGSKVRVKGYTISCDNDTNIISVTLNLNNMLLEKIIEIDQSNQRLALISG
jgi:hypothetical protein